MNPHCLAFNRKLQAGSMVANATRTACFACIQQKIARDPVTVYNAVVSKLSCIQQKIASVFVSCSYVNYFETLFLAFNRKLQDFTTQLGSVERDVTCIQQKIARHGTCWTLQSHQGRYTCIQQKIASFSLWGTLWSSRMVRCCINRKCKQLGQWIPKTIEQMPLHSTEKCKVG